MARRKSESQSQKLIKLEQVNNTKDSKTNEAIITEKEKRDNKIRTLQDIGGKIIIKQNTKHKSLMDSWIDFTNKMNTQLMDNKKEQQNEYEHMYGDWMNISSVMINELTKTIQEDDTNYQELYNVWKNYTNNIGGQLSKILKNGNNLFESFQMTWHDQSEIMTKQFLGLTEKGETTAEGVYWSLLDFNKRLNEEIGRLITGNHTEHYELINIWSEYNDKIVNIITSSVDENKITHKGFSKNWSDFSNNLRENMENFFQEHEKQLENITNVYQNQVEGIKTRVAKVFKTISSDYEKMFRTYLERTNNFQKGFGKFSMSREQSLSTNVEELKSKDKQLEDKLKKVEK